jgi:hypothetical protein
LVTVIAFATILIRSNVSAIYDAGSRDYPSAHLSRVMLFAGLWAVIFLTSGGVTYAISNWILKITLTLLAVVAAVFFLINTNLESVRKIFAVVFGLFTPLWSGNGSCDRSTVRAAGA